MQSITPAELAELVHTDQKRVRKFLREITPKEAQPGRGRRWNLKGDKRSITRLQKQYDNWSSHAKAS
jgi:hypothetical protein